MPIATTYKGVGIHAGQSAKRVRLVKGEIVNVGLRLTPLSGNLRTAGLASIRWADPTHYCSLLDAHPERAAKREEPLADEEE
jgi:hypothetical protein